VVVVAFPGRVLGDHDGFPVEPDGREFPVAAFVVVDADEDAPLDALGFPVFLVDGVGQVEFGDVLVAEAVEVVQVVGDGLRLHRVQRGRSGVGAHFASPLR
jgi:hypothetical protein